MAWVANSALANEVIDSGADGLLLRPFSADILDQRIRTHVLNQKPFIVTDSYVGPERRDSAKRSPAEFSFVPPNSLKMKIGGRQHIDEANRRFNAELRAASGRLAAELKRRNTMTLQN
jgi:hypothetical protein